MSTNPTQHTPGPWKLRRRFDMHQDITRFAAGDLPLHWTRSANRVHAIIIGQDMNNRECQRHGCQNDATTLCSGPLPGEKNWACDDHKMGCGVMPCEPEKLVAIATKTDKYEASARVKSGMAFALFKVGDAADSDELWFAGYVEGSRMRGEMYERINGALSRCGIAAIAEVSLVLFSVQ